jgi:hypothetical protein
MTGQNIAVMQTKVIDFSLHDCLIVEALAIGQAEHSVRRARKPERFCLPRSRP